MSTPLTPCEHKTRERRTLGWPVTCGRLSLKAQLDSGVIGTYEPFELSVSWQPTTMDLGHSSSVVALDEPNHVQFQAS